jgi:hypothetical protein
VQNLLDYVEGGSTIDEFFVDYPSVTRDQVIQFLELAKEAKVARIAALDCEVFIDDLPEIFASPDFPASARRILFDPADQFAELARQRQLDRCRSWTEIAAELCREHV